MNVEDDFIRDLFTRGQTQTGRTFIHKPALSKENALHVLDCERAGQVIKNATHRGVGICYCRHNKHHIGRDCKAPKQICMTFNNTAASLTKYGHAQNKNG